MGKVDFSVKTKACAIVLHLCVDLLKSFMDISANIGDLDADKKLMWKVISYDDICDIRLTVCCYGPKLVGETKKKH
jgi:hypothetical protein